MTASPGEASEPQEQSSSIALSLDDLEVSIFDPNLNDQVPLRADLGHTTTLCPSDGMGGGPCQPGDTCSCPCETDPCTNQGCPTTFLDCL